VSCQIFGARLCASLSALGSFKLMVTSPSARGSLPFGNIEAANCANLQSCSHLIGDPQIFAEVICPAAFGDGIGLLDDALGFGFGYCTSHLSGGYHQRAYRVFAVRVMPLPCDEYGAEVVSVGNINGACKATDLGPPRCRQIEALLVFHATGCHLEKTPLMAAP
jgi:hypothetical protein